MGSVPIVNKRYQHITQKDKQCIVTTVDLDNNRIYYTSYYTNNKVGMDQSLPIVKFNNTYMCIVKIKNIPDNWEDV